MESPSRVAAGEASLGRSSNPGDQAVITSIHRAPDSRSEKRLTILSDLADAACDKRNPVRLRRNNETKMFNEHAMRVG